MGRRRLTGLLLAVLALTAGYPVSGLLWTRWQLRGARQRLSRLRWAPLSYTSAVDRTPLQALMVWPRAPRAPLPLLVLVHGYTESAADLFSAATHWAEQGWLVLLPDMRGRVSQLRFPLGELEQQPPLGLALPGWGRMVRSAAAPLASGRFVSGGEPDSCGLELLDIRDAVRAVRERFGARLQSGQSIVGYSGGGTAALLLAMRVPGLFQRVVALFPIVDFAAQWSLLSRQDPAKQRTMARWIGGSPRQVPTRYAARRVQSGLGNLRQSAVLVLADSEDQLIPRDQLLNLALLAREQPNIEVRLSSLGDDQRWQHETPLYRSPLHRIELAALRPPPAPSRPPSSWTVLGHLLLPDVELWLGNGQQGAARVELARSAEALQVTVHPLQVPPGLRLSVRVRTATRWRTFANLAPRGSHRLQLR